ncbi:MAG: hypothetical protein JO127_14370 [Caulobacteraceae bacterium]|nr:hypothetical protein [Caulobacteraceae bacterium]
MTYKVIKGFTGRIGKKIVRMVAEHPDMEFVGGLVYHPEKDGMDLGELAGIAPLGVKATSDLDAICAMEADVVLLNNSQHDWELIAKLLRSGKNIVTNNGAFYVRHQPERELLESACQEGRSSIIGTGNTPGLINECVPLFMTGFSVDVRRIFCKEATYPLTFFMAGDAAAQSGGEAVGLGLPFHPSMTSTESALARSYHWFYEQPAHLVANAFGFEFDRCACTDVKIGVVQNDTYVPELDYTFRAGTVGGWRTQHTGFVKGEPWYTYECENVWVLGLEGMRSAADEPEFTCEIHGTPSLKMALSTTPLGGLRSSENVLEINAARMVNLVPFIVGAAPGCRSILDAPFDINSWARVAGQQRLSPRALRR